MAFNLLNMTIGGGLLSNNEKSEIDKSSVHICIGLGGTGMSELRTLKKMVYDRIKPDDENASIPRYNNVRFIGIDTDPTGQGLADSGFASIQDEEFVSIGMNDIQSLLKNKGILENRPELKWFNTEKITIENAEAGAGGVRQIGRYLLFKNWDIISNKITAAINSSIAGLNNAHVYVHIFAGIGGGTGSGTFIDTCYMVKNILTKASLSARSSVLGYVFLPDVNLSDPVCASDPLRVEYICRNGFSALKEIDYLMGVEKSGDRITQYYTATDSNVSLSEPPVKMCHLISATDVSGNIMENAYSYIMNVTSEYILNYIASPGSNPGEDTSKNIVTLSGHMANLAQMIAGMHKRYGANYSYFVIGGSSAIVPYKKLATYLTSYLFSYFTKNLTNLPTETDCENVCRSARLSFEALKTDVRAGTPPITLDPKNFDKNAVRAAINVAENTWCAAIHQSVMHVKAKIDGKMDENVLNLGKPIDDYTAVSDSVVSVSGKIFRYLCENYMKSGYGPHFVSNLIRSANSKDLYLRVEGIKKTTKERLADAIVQQGYIEKLLADTGTKFKSKGAGLFDANYKDYIAACQQYGNNLIEIETLNRMNTVLNKVQDQLLKIKSDYFDKFAKVMTDFDVVFKINREAIEAGTIKPMSYVKEIVDIYSIKPMLDAQLKEKLVAAADGTLNADRHYDAFVAMLMKHYKEWSDIMDENVLVKLITNFILNSPDANNGMPKGLFYDEVSKSLTSYLEKKYDAEGNPVALQKAIKETLIAQTLVPAAAPVYFMNGLAKEEVGNVPEYSVISVPYNANDIVSAAQDYVAQDTHLGVRKTSISDRITAMSFYGGLPLFTYNKLDQYSKYYDLKHDDGGKHLYETGERNWTGDLIMPYPYEFGKRLASFERYPAEAEKIERCKELFFKAVKAGSIIDVDGTIKIAEPVACDIDAIITAAGGLTENGRKTVVSLNRAKAALEAKYNAYFTVDGTTTLHIFKTEGNLITKEENEQHSKISVALDDFLRYNVYCKLVDKIMSNYDALAAKITELQNEIDGIIVGGKEQQSFFNALFVGVVVPVPGKITYKVMIDGLEQAGVLTDAQSTYGASPLYCAYDNFKNLEDYIKKAILSKVDEILENLDVAANADQMKAALENCDKFLAKERLAVQYSPMTVANYANKDEVCKFYVDYFTAKATFETTYSF